MSKGNDQIIRTVPGTDVGGHDTAGTDGEPRTERAGEILGTVDPDGTDGRANGRRAKARQHETDRADYVTAEVDRANREDLPKLGGDADLDDWKPGNAPAEAAAPAIVTPTK